MESKSSAIKAWKKAAYIALLLAAIGYLLVNIYTPDLYHPVCIFHRLTGLYCAGCGGTRAMAALLQGDVLLALRDNALIILLLPAAFYFYLRGFLITFFGKTRLPAPKNTAPWLWALLASTAVFMIIRNFDFFTFLKPV
jgi:hypothetical protein